MAVIGSDSDIELSESFTCHAKHDQGRPLKNYYYQRSLVVK